MRVHAIRSVSRRAFCVTTQSQHALPLAPNILAQNFSVGVIPAINCVWAGDITYIPTQEGWLYLAVVLDLYSRRVVGWSMSNRLDRGLALGAFNMALLQRRPSAGLLYHSDRASQYACGEFRTLLRGSGVVCSMSRKGNCWDNAVAESFFATLKT